MSFCIGDDKWNVVEQMKFSYMEQVECFLDAHYENINEVLNLPAHNKKFFIYELTTAHLENRTDDVYDYSEENMKYSLTKDDVPSVIPELRKVSQNIYMFRRTIYVVCKV